MEFTIMKIFNEDHTVKKEMFVDRQSNQVFQTLEDSKRVYTIFGFIKIVKNIKINNDVSLVINGSNKVGFVHEKEN
jgi:hypothetical protein